MTDDVVDLASDDPDKLSKEDEVDASTDANSIKPKERITNDDDNAQKGSNAADYSVKNTNMGVVGSEGGVPASATKLAPKKGAVGFANDVKMIYDKDKIG